MIQTWLTVSTFMLFGPNQQRRGRRRAAEPRVDVTAQQHYFWDVSVRPGLLTHT